MGLAGLDFDAAWSRRVTGSYGEVPTQFLSIEDLIINKQAVGRLQDLMDVESLRLAQQRNLLKESPLALEPGKELEQKREQKPRNKRNR